MPVSKFSPWHRNREPWKKIMSAILLLLSTMSCFFLGPPVPTPLGPQRTEESREIAESCPDTLGFVWVCVLVWRNTDCTNNPPPKLFAKLLVSVLSVVQVLSYNLYTVLNIPHDPVALEEHFQDDDEGPVSNHGYMPYLNKYILDKVENKQKVPICVKNLGK